jgi:hypothetical protein
MLNALGTVLEEQRLGPYDIVICGAMALLLQGMVDRPTRDIDGLGLVVDEGGSLELKKPLLDKEFYKAVERVGSLFHEGRLWFSTAATTLHDDTRLPKGLVERAQVRHYGSRLTIRLCSRQDMVCLKMWAALRRGEPDTSDLIEMRISEEEAGKGALWCLEQDGEALPEIRKLLEELGHGKLAERLD